MPEQADVKPAIVILDGAFGDAPPQILSAVPASGDHDQRDTGRGRP